MSKDPYQPPTADPAPPAKEAIPPATATLPVVVEHLVHTRPWVKFCSLAGYVAAAFLVLIAILTLRGALGQYAFHSLLLLAGFYLILAVLIAIPSVWLSKYEKSIIRLQQSNHIEDLEQAVADQRSFWRQMAIMILIMLLLYIMTVAFSAIVLLSSG